MIIYDLKYTLIFIFKLLLWMRGGSIVAFCVDFAFSLTLKSHSKINYYFSKNKILMLK